MIWAQFNDPVSHVCLAGAVATINISVTEFSEKYLELKPFRENSNV